MVSHALKLGLMEAEAYHQTTVFEAGTLFARTEGIVPHPNPRTPSPPWSRRRAGPVSQAESA